MLRPQKDSSLQTPKWSGLEDQWLGLWAEITEEAHVYQKHKTPPAEHRDVEERLDGWDEGNFMSHSVWSGDPLWMTLG